jgi:hypothetical protein
LDVLAKIDNFLPLEQVFALASLIILLIIHLRLFHRQQYRLVQLLIGQSYQQLDAEFASHVVKRYHL